MIIGCWNIRGLNDPIKHSELRRLIHQERIALFSLVETQVKDKNKDNVSQLFCVFGPSCIIMISLVVGVFGFVGMLIR
jgi:hypothetical protein